MDYDDTVTEIDLKGVLPEFSQQASGDELDLWVEGWSASFGARLLSLFRDPRA